VVKAWHFYDTEFGYGDKDHTNILKLRLSIGVVTWVEFKDGTRQKTLAKFEMIIKDWKEHMGRTPMKLDRTTSWYTSICSAPCNAVVARAPEKEVVENFVAYLRARACALRSYSSLESSMSLPATAVIVQTFPPLMP
jgi:hypothetical protein